MNHRSVASHPQAPALSEGCDLAPHRAQSVHAREARRLHILHGRVWLTLGGADQPGDHFLAAGDSLLLPAGARAVFEAYPAQQPVRWACSAGVGAQAAPSLLQWLRFWVAVLGVGVRAGLRAATAAASASRAQGCISPGDSSASAGGVA